MLFLQKRYAPNRVLTVLAIHDLESDKDVWNEELEGHNTADAKFLLLKAAEKYFKDKGEILPNWAESWKCSDENGRPVGDASTKNAGSRVKAPVNKRPKLKAKKRT